MLLLLTLQLISRPVLPSCKAAWSILCKGNYVMDRRDGVTNEELQTAHCC